MGINNLQAGRKTSENGRPGLVRGLGRFDVVALTVNVIIGAGIFALPSGLASAAGRWSIVVLVTAIAVTALLALSLVEVASRYPTTGGPPVIAADAFGPTAGFTVGWMLWLARAVANAAVSKLMLDYAAAFWPAMSEWWPRTLAFTALILVFAVFNIRGVTRGALVSNLLTVAKLLPLVPLAVAGLWLAGWNHVPAAEPREPDGIITALTLALYACFGFEQAAIVSGEMRDPRRDQAAGILGGTAIAGVLFLLVVFACFALVPDVAASSRPVADAAAALAGPVGGIVVALGAVVSCAGNIAAGVLTAPRVLYALGESGDLPRPLTAVHERYRTPWVAILAYTVVVWLLAVSNTFTYLVTIYVIARILIYGSASGALLVMRRRAGAAPVPVAGGPAIAVVALLACMAILFTVDWKATRDVAIALAAGFVIRALVRARRPAS